MPSQMNFSPALYACLGLLFAGLGAANASAGSVEELTAWLTGDFANQTQIETLEDGVLTSATPGQPWVDPLFARFRAADVTGLDGAAIYLQWHNETVAGPVSRQRIWLFRETPSGLTMEFFMLKPEAAERLAQAQPDVLNLSDDDLIGYPDECDLPFQKQGLTYMGAIPETCKIVAQQSARTMFIGAWIEISADGLSYRESGLTPDGVEVFKVPGVGAYQFQRLEQRD